MINFHFSIFKQFQIKQFLIMQYDLEERTINFSKKIIALIKKIKINRLNENIVSQLLRSSTSVGANYREANAGVSRNDFRNKVYIVRKEIQETKYWIELLAEVNLEFKEDLRVLWKEANELSLIFSKITHSLKIKN